MSTQLHFNLLEMSNLKDVTKQLLKFRDERDWEQFHKPKDLALALSIEAAELNELFLWKSTDDQIDLARVEEELADITSYLIYLSHHYNFDLATLVAKKIEQNALKYPIEKSKGSAIKYTDLE